LHNLRFAYALAINDLRVRFSRTAFGWWWLIINPLALLSLYGVLFGVVLGLSWKAPDDGEDMGFVLPFLCGLSCYLFLSDLLSSSLSLYSSKRGFISKTSYDLWVIWLSNMIRATLIFLVYLSILLALAFLFGHLSLSVAWGLPLIAVFTLIGFGGISLLISMLAPFFQDLRELNTLIQRVLFYSGTVTYPITLIPDQYAQYLWINPITCIAYTLRELLVFGTQPSLDVLGYFAIGTSAFFLLAWLLYSRVNEAVVDVV